MIVCAQRDFVASIQLCIQNTGNQTSIKMESVQPQIIFL